MQKKYRLTRRGSFSYAYRKRDCVVTERLAVYKVPAATLKIGISVGKKIGNSVVRSRVKRRIGERFRLLIPHVSERYNYVVTARSACAEASSAEINADLISALKKHGAYKDEA